MQVYPCVLYDLPRFQPIPHIGQSLLAHLFHPNGRKARQIRHVYPAVEVEIPRQPHHKVVFPGLITVSRHPHPIRPVRLQLNQQSRVQPTRVITVIIIARQLICFRTPLEHRQRCIIGTAAHVHHVHPADARHEPMPYIARIIGVGAIGNVFAGPGRPLRGPHVNLAVLQFNRLIAVVMSRPRHQRPELSRDLLVGVHGNADQLTRIADPPAPLPKPPTHARIAIQLHHTARIIP